MKWKKIQPIKHNKIRYMSDTLNKINETKRDEISALKKRFSQAELEDQARQAEAPSYASNKARISAG